MRRAAGRQHAPGREPGSRPGWWTERLDRWTAGLDTTRGSGLDARSRPAASDSGGWTAGQLDGTCWTPASGAVAEARPREFDGFEVGGWLGRVMGGQEVQQVCRDGGGDGGPCPDPEPQSRGGVERGAGSEVDGLCESGQPRRGHHDRPRIAGRRAGQPAGGTVGDERQAVGDQRVEPGDPGRHCGGERNLVEPVSCGHRGAERDRQAGKPEQSARAARGDRWAPVIVRSRS